MKVLSLDTSTRISSVALLDDDQLLAENNTCVHAKHGETLLASIQRVLESAQMTMADVELIAVGLGPGSFTGVRIGMAAAKGFALARRTPVIGTVSLQTLACAIADRSAIAVAAIDAHKGEVFAAAYSWNEDGSANEHVAPFHDTPERAGARIREKLDDAPVSICGDALGVYREQLLGALGANTTVMTPLYEVPRAAMAGEMALAKWRRRGADDLATLVPLYLRGSDARLPQPPLA